MASAPNCCPEAPHLIPTHIQTHKAGLFTKTLTSLKEGKPKRKQVSPFFFLPLRLSGRLEVRLQEGLSLRARSIQVGFRK